MGKKFSEFGKSDKSLKHELGSIERSCLSHVSCWCLVASWSLIQEMAGSNILFKFIIFLPLNSATSMKTFRENSIKVSNRLP